MMNILIFLPRTIDIKKPGYIFGKIAHDRSKDIMKFFIIGVREREFIETNKFLNIIGYYHNTKCSYKFRDKRHADWIDMYMSKQKTSRKTEYIYHLENIIIDGKTVSTLSCSRILIIYDQAALQETELFINQTPSSDHFYELMKILQNEETKEEMNYDRSILTNTNEILMKYCALLFFYPILCLAKATNKSLVILRHSSLGLYLNGWLENTKWTLFDIIHKRKITLKTGNYIVATILDIIIGITALQVLLKYLDNISPSELLLNNAEKVVESLKNLIHWLMGAPAGLKLNYAFNNMLGKFFLYHIHLWWTFLTFVAPMMDFAFNVLMLFGRLGITFQISITADLLALISFHTYCIYVYAVRLFNIQLSALTSLFQLILGKKKNPLRERVDSCQYRPDQLFVGTLLFTILLFLMPTTWVYYSVFTMLRLLLIALGGLLTRLRFYLQVMPVYAFLKWLFNSHSTRSSIHITLHSYQMEEDRIITILMTMVTSPWTETWKQCIIDTIAFCPPIEWNKMLNNVIWGQLVYPL